MYCRSYGPSNSPNKPVNHFSGWMDELRIWDIGLSPDHIRQMMNQQIIDMSEPRRNNPNDINGPDTNAKMASMTKPLTWLTRRYVVYTK
jgi:hypothetical protein